MWEIRLVTVGRPKNPGIRENLERYRTMVGGEWNLSLEHVPAERNGAPSRRRREEGRRLRSRIPSHGHAVALDPGGKTMNSESFAQMMTKEKDRGRPVTFIVGGAHGLDDGVLSACETRLSLTPMTLTHEMAALVLAEQIYRAYAAWSGRPYAK
jgi:23S rRNA (pseudouridine1915-N3)-methyltransferase